MFTYTPMRTRTLTITRTHSHTPIGIVSARQRASILFGMLWVTLRRPAVWNPAFWDEHSMFWTSLR